MIRLAVLMLMLATSAFAQERRPSHCIALAQSTPGLEYLHKVSFRAPLPEHTVRIRYIAHASFLIQAGEYDAVTDFTGFIGSADLIPDIVTMNHAHSTHWTASPDPAIPHVLPGWGDYGQGIEHHLDLGSLVVRNVSTDIRSGGGVEPKGNSIFVFEAEGLCIAHLGHLHHEPTDDQYAALGRMDVVMAPVDGGYTMAIENMMNVLRRVKASIVIPMHWFADASLGRFLAGMEEDFAIERPGSSEIEVSLRTLPDRPTIIVLQPAWLRDNE
ncbi:L-ascorbate metabolism protein UlaG, beta-lactamase superfamily [Roseovarius azorensis]|uniref:L-ascorbate metabolism protein UlaG, beta-lactamase superfamily n=1 Tax=Roseovarius azorensis TaxID=1287727 RepID=A0A1H7FGK4_9RHOB|nr:MBL fold metallo-hydrolase [Roseovarius azorensis]SEK24904.1 L-ascorbate metabolism protein UlaG, beta-lactamase superfamily [Roseovarius azorensis]